MASNPASNPTEFIPGSDVEMDLRDDDQPPLPQSGFAAYRNDGTNFLPKTDWSRDGIIANDD